MQRTSLAMALAFCLVLPALGGCGLLGGDDESPGVQTEAPAAKPSTETADGADTPNRVSVPKVVGLDARDAQRALRNVGLEPTFIWKRNDADRLTVVRQSNVDGEFVAPGSYIQLTVSLGPTPEQPLPPFVIYELEQAAKAAEEAAAAGSGGGGGGGEGGDTSGTGSGTSVTAEDNANAIPGVPLPASPTSGELSVGDANDVYRINILTGQSLVVSVDEGSSATDTDYQVFLYPPTAEDFTDSTVKQVTTGSYPRNLTYTATTTGDFYIRVYHAGTSSGSGGDYTLTWSIGS